jgi:MYXO-CTERM domain-containing protein
VIGPGVAIASAAVLGIAEPRPTEGGLWSFAPTDVVEVWDEPTGHVRVHFSVAGPSTTHLDDRDGDLVPDFPQEVARVTAEALGLWAEALGLRPPVPETEVGEALGGSEALDVYLVDFAGAADGRFGIDGCIGFEDRCAGFLVLENDFRGYGYATLAEAIATVASHESFHAVQAAYAELPSWMSEGTATWATRRFDSTLPDFVDACAGYLADPGRPIHEPPLGPVPAFAYGSALWWDFLATRSGDGVIAAVLEAMDAADGSAPAEVVMQGAVERSGDALDDAWATFARWNLAAGFRAGAAPSHAYAPELVAIEPDAQGPTIDVSARLYPLAASYWRIDHAGGSLVFGCDAALGGALFSLHPVSEGAADGPVQDAVAVWDAPEAGAFVIPDADDLAAGGWFVVATLPVLADASLQARVCIGTEEHVATCGLDVPSADGTTDGGSTTHEGETTEDAGTIGSDGSSGAPALDADDASVNETGSGCACASSSGGGGPLAPMLVLLVGVPALRTRRRRAR